MSSKSIPNLHNVFIDTGIFIDLLKIDLSSSTDDVKSRINQTRSFFEALIELKLKITYQTSSLNIAELFHCGNKNQETLEAMLTVTTPNDLEIISFDTDASLYHNGWVASFLGRSSIKDIQKQVNYPIATNFANVEDRIRKDMLICATAKMYNVDIVLTNDRGFKKLCEILELPCHCFSGNPADFITSHDGVKIYDFA